MNLLALRVAARFQRLADQAPGQRQHAQKLTQPINRPKGIDREIAESHGDVMNGTSEAVEPDRRDVRPWDVFAPTPNQMGVLNLAQTGHGLEKATEKQIQKDKGYETVKNLSQYLIRTDGGGEGGPQGKKL